MVCLHMWIYVSIALSILILTQNQIWQRDIWKEVKWDFLHCFISRERHLSVNSTFVFVFSTLCDFKEQQQWVYVAFIQNAKCPPNISKPVGNPAQRYFYLSLHWRYLVCSCPLSLPMQLIVFPLDWTRLQNPGFTFPPVLSLHTTAIRDTQWVFSVFKSRSLVIWTLFQFWHCWAVRSWSTPSPEMAHPQTKRA